ncbi:MAG TPA: prephenate dehydrogenase/arogenate dehydrogenase family protein [candidate division Zixibacteria bacterium]|nr:prephenate dehydrogenase/arogenate dehydrogenase family protein [candidate division Zixibacteria bacterium]
MIGQQQLSLFEGAHTPKLRPLSRAQAQVRTITICGVGLIGGSIAERLRRRFRGLTVLGYDRDSVIRAALRAKVISRGATSLSQALAASDLVILSATPSANERLLTQLARARVTTDALICDTGSTQGAISRHAAGLNWNNAARFIAGHPMAGREVQGLANRQGELFQRHPFFFDASIALSARDRRRIQWFAQALGSYPIFVNSERHDRIMTDLSHIPQLVSTVIGAFVAGFDQRTIQLAGTGLQSMIRLGGSPYSNWRDVFADNRDNLVDRLDALIAALAQVRKEIARGGDLAGRFREAQRSYRCLW